MIHFSGEMWPPMGSHMVICTGMGSRAIGTPEKRAECTLELRRGTERSGGMSRVLTRSSSGLMCRGSLTGASRQVIRRYYAWLWRRFHDCIVYQDKQHRRALWGAYGGIRDDEENMCITLVRIHCLIWTYNAITLWASIYILSWSTARYQRYGRIRCFVNKKGWDLYVNCVC
jgi:hypothetical protein